MVAQPSFGLVHLLVLLSGSLLGLPPAERDEMLVRCAPKEAIVYSEWSARGPGKEGQPGVEGLAADPEIRQFLADAEHAIVSFAQVQSAHGGESAQVLSANLPGLVHTLISRPGCIFVSLDERVVKATAEHSGGGPPTMANAIAAVNAVLVINGGDQAETLDQSLRALLPLLPDPPKTNDLKNVSIRLPGFPLPVSLQRHDKYFLLSVGEHAAESAVSGLDGKSKGLLENERFVAAEKQVSGGKTSGVTWFDLKTGMSQVTALLGPYASFAEAIVKLVGVNEIDSVLAHTGIVEGEVRSTCWMATSGKTSGILTLAAGRGIQATDLAVIPADADLAAAVSLDLTKIFNEIQRIVTGTSLGAGTSFDDSVKRFEDNLGLSVKNDLLAAFGEVWTLSDSPAEGGLFVTSLVAGLEVRDRAKANKVFERLKHLATEQLHLAEPGRRHSGASLEVRTFLGEKIYFVNTVGSDMPLAPAFCLTDSRFLAALHPQAIKARLRFLKDKGVALVPGTGGPPLREGGATIGYATFDMKRLIGLLYPIVPYASEMISSRLQEQGIPLDTFSCPSARAIMPYAGPCSCVATRMEKGILIETRSLLPLPDTSSMMVIPSLIGAARARR